MKSLNKIFKLIKPHKKAMIVIIILSIIIVIGEIIRPYLIKIAIDDYLSMGIWQKGVISLGLLGAIYIGIVILNNILDFITKTATSMMGENIVYTTRNKLYKYIQHANITFHDKTPAGKLFVRITNDVEDIANVFKEIITTIIQDVIIIFALISIMLYINSKISMYAFIIIPLIIISALVCTKISNKLYNISKNAKTNLNTFLAESIYGEKLIKIFNRQKEKQQECEQLTNAYWKSRLPIGTIEGIIVAIMTILENLGVSIIVWVCINNLVGVNIEVGIIYIFINYIQQLFAPITRLVENVETIQEAIVSIDKIDEILKHKEYLEDLEKGQVLNEIAGQIEFKNVWFAYEGENWVLKDISFKIEPGQSIALVGKTGSRKNYYN